MVLTTSVERPEAMCCAPSGATTTVFITPVRVIYIYIYIYIYTGAGHIIRISSKS